MKCLVDSHSLIWYVDQDHLLNHAAHAAITNPVNDLLFSAATIWEIAIKVGLGKLPLSVPYRHWMTKAIADLGLVVLPITVECMQTYRRGFPCIIETPLTACLSLRHSLNRFR